jgi:hypothetical protein
MPIYMGVSRLLSWLMNLRIGGFIAARIPLALHMKQRLSVLEGTGLNEYGTMGNILVFCNFGSKFAVLNV